MSTTQRPLQPLVATLRDARDECDELYDTVASAVAYQIASDVASFAMVVGAMSETREELNRLLDEVIREIVRGSRSSEGAVLMRGLQEHFDLVTENTVQTEGWIRDLRASIGRCPEDYAMLPYFAHQTGSLIARLTERRSRADMRTLARSREKALRSARLVQQLANASMDLGERVRRNLEYLCSPTAADAAMHAQWEALPELVDQREPINFETEF